MHVERRAMLNDVQSSWLVWRWLCGGLHVNRSKIDRSGGRCVYRVSGTFLRDSKNSKERKLDVLTNVTQKAVSTMTSTGHSKHDKAHVPSLCQQMRSSKNVHNEHWLSVDNSSVDPPSDAVSQWKQESLAFPALFEWILKQSHVHLWQWLIHLCQIQIQGALGCSRQEDTSSIGRKKVNNPPNNWLVQFRLLSHVQVL